MQFRATSEPSVPWTSNPVGMCLIVKASWNWTSAPRFMRMTPITVSGQPALAHAVGRRHRRDLSRVVADNEPDRVGIMHCYVQHDSAARRRAVDPPALQEPGQEDGVEDANGKNVADRALRDQVTHAPMKPGVAQMMVGRHDHSCLLARVNHLLRIRQRQRQRLLAKHVLSGPRRGDGLVVVMLVGRADVDAVDAGIGEHRVKRVKVPRQPVIRSECGATLRTRADDTDHLGIGLRIDRPDHVLPGNIARPDQPPPRHGTLRAIPGFQVSGFPSTLNPVYWYITKSGAGSRSTTSSGFISGLS